MSPKLFSCLPAALVVPLFLIGPAHAQSTAPVTVVTADSLAGAGVLTADDLEAFQAVSVDDLNGLTPGLNIISADAAGYGNVYTMRGSGNVLFFGPPAVGLSLDGIPQANAFAYPTELIELEAVHVHRGPRGAYTGRNSAAGQIELITPRPTHDQVFRLRTDYGSYDSFGAGLFSSGPVAGDISHTLQLYYNERDGNVHKTLLGGKRDDRQSYGGELKVYWNPDYRTEAWLGFGAEEVDDGDQRLTRLDSPDPFEVRSDRPGVTEIERYRLSNFFSREYDWGTVTAKGGFSWWDLDPNTVDLDLSDSFLDQFSRIEQEQDSFSQELRYDSPAEASFRWTAGLFFLDVDNDGEAFRNLAPGFDETTSFEIDESNFALFLNGQYDLNEAVTLEAGLRIDYHEAEIDRIKTSLAGAAPVNEDLDDVYFSPTAAIHYRATDALLFHARTGLGIKPAGFTAYSDDPDDAEYDEETNWSTEIGVQYIPCEEVQMGLRAYFNQIDDYQVNQSLAGAGLTDFIITNADEVTVWGIEADLIWRPTECLTIRGAFGWQDAEFDDYVFTNARLPGSADFSDNQVPFIPEFTGSLGLAYDFGNGFYFNTAVRGFGRTYFDSDESSGFSQGSYALWDAEIGYRANGYSLAVYGRNMLDEDYYTFINPNIEAGAPGDPAVVGIRASLEF